MRSLGQVIIWTDLELRSTQILKQNPTDAEVQDLINEVDVDGSGALGKHLNTLPGNIKNKWFSIDFSEFCLMMVKKMSESNCDTETLEAYRVFDKDMDGFITRSELRMIFSALPERLTPEEIEEMLEAADEDGKIRGH